MFLWRKLTSAGVLTCLRDILWEVLGEQEGVPIWSSPFLIGVLVTRVPSFCQASLNLLPQLNHITSLSRELKMRKQFWRERGCSSLFVARPQCRPCTFTLQTQD